MHLELSDAEAGILKEVLTDYLPGLKREAARTERHDFRHMLVQRQELCERLIERLGAAAPR
jgi:hypothetical protein